MIMKTEAAIPVHLPEISNKKARPNPKQLLRLAAAIQKESDLLPESCNKHAGAVGHEMLAGALRQANSFVKSCALIAPKHADCGCCNFAFGSRARCWVMARGLQFRP
jgi:hypothetical protein